jgi:hypothetical protein
VRKLSVELGEYKAESKAIKNQDLTLRKQVGGWVGEELWRVHMGMSCRSQFQSRDSSGVWRNMCSVAGLPCILSNQLDWAGPHVYMWEQPTCNRLSFCCLQLLLYF